MNGFKKSNWTPRWTGCYVSFEANAAPMLAFLARLDPRVEYRVRNHLGKENKKRRTFRRCPFKR